ncbi:MAG: family 4 glycosyl hydrolase [Promethearchaeota archaeon]
MTFKIVYIGAGSFRFSIVLFMDICRAIELSPIEVWLVDIDKRSLDIMTRAFKQMVKKAEKRLGINIKVFSTTDRCEALENADFIYKSISVGIQAAEFYDIYIPFKFGIPQNTGDTVGPGGLFRALRTNPVCAEIAKDIKKYCPKAPILSYTNPQSTIVLAAKTVAPNIQWMGLCHELFGGMKTLKKFYEKYANIKVNRWEDFDIEYCGVNHFTWLTKINLNGKDLYPILREKAHDMVLKNFNNRGFNFHLCEEFGYFSIPGSRHVAEFLPKYYNYFNHEIQCSYWKFPTIRDVIRLERMRKFAYKLYNLIAKGIIVPKPRHSGEKAIDMTLDWKNSIEISGKNQTQHVVNIPNEGIIPELPENCVVEVPAYFENGIISLIKPIHMPKKIVELVRPHAEQHQLTINAALGNDLDLIIKAILHDPLCEWIEDPDRVEYMAKLMLYYEQNWLPKEWKEWIPTKDELEKSKYWISPKELSRKNKNYLKKKFPIDEKLRKKAFFYEK